MDRNGADRWRPVLPPGRTVELAGRGRTFVRELGGPAGAPTVLLLHGWTSTADLNWYPSFAPLARSFHVVALDHRGHGRGLRSERPFRLDECADDAAALLDVLGIERCIAVGYSMGGAIAQLLRRRRPDLVTGLVLCATSATFNVTLRHRVLFGMATGGRVVAGAVPVRPVSAVALQVARSWRSVRREPWWGFDEVARHDWREILEAGRQIGRFDSRRWVGDVGVPTAVIATDQDDLVPHHRQLALARAIPEATLRIVEGGHTVCTAAPERYVPALLAACHETLERAASPAAADDSDVA